MWNAILGIPAVVKRLALVVLGCAMLFAGARYVAASPETRLGLPQDWTHRHVVFSRPHDVATLMAIRQDPRFLHQLLKSGALSGGSARTALAQPSGTQMNDGEDGTNQPGNQPRQRRPDWSVTLGAAGAILPRSTYPAKYTFNVNTPPDCINDYVVFPTLVGGSTTQATLVAFNQLYSTQGGAGGLCGTAGPSVKWAYFNTGGGVRSSPVISADGTKVAFSTRSPGALHVLTIGTTGANGTSVNAPAAPGVGNNAVLSTVRLSGGATVTDSAVFPDYQDDLAYIGDDAGVLHKITGLFGGTPAEVVTGGWPVTVSGAALNGPVFDLVTKNIFVTDQGGNLSYVRDIGSTAGTCAAGAPPCLGATVLAISPGTPLADSPIVDSSNGRVYTETSAGATNSVIIQTDTALGSVVTVAVGPADPGNPLHNGAFDNTYFNNVGAGSYYACGRDTTTTFPTLYSIGFNSSGVMNSAPNAATLPLAHAAAQCSPMTEFLNTSAGVDWLFVGVSAKCGPGGGGGLASGCVLSYNITSGMPAGLSAHSATERGGSSGIIVDNVSTAAQASSIYFSDEANGPCGDGSTNSGCAVKLTQSGLK